MLRHLLVLLVISTANLSFASAAVKGLSISGVQLNADDLSRDYETKELLLKGNVEIGFDNNILKADEAKLNLKTRVLTATGNVQIKSDDTYIEGSSIVYDLNAKTAVIDDGFVQSGQIAFEGSLVEKTGEHSYIAQDATYTACLTCPPAWSFSGKTIEAEIGGYAFIKYPVLRIGHFPVFILPRLIVPLKSNRQSGLLVPSLSFSKKGGAAIEQSYFWAVDKSRDATFTFRKYENRGLKQNLEYRYVISEKSKGVLRASYIEDKSYTIDGTPENGTNTFTLPRGFIHYDHHYELPNDYVQRIELNYVTDLRYVRDFSTDLEGVHGQSALANNVSLAKNTETQHRSIDASFYINLLQAEDPVNTAGDALSRNDDSVHRWPEIKFNSVEQELGDSNFFWKFDFSYSHFVRRDFSYDDIQDLNADPDKYDYVVRPVRDGSFDPDTDLIRTGHRTILSPTLSYPIKVSNVLEILPTLSYSEAHYRFTTKPDVAVSNYENRAELRYVAADISMKTVFSGIYGENSQTNPRYKHEIIPELSFSTIPWIERPDHIFFGNSDNQSYSRSQTSVGNSDFNSSSRLQFDYRDRVYDKSLVQLGITNTLVRKTYKSGNPDFQRLVKHKLTQSYDIKEEQSGNTHTRPWSAITSLLDMRYNQFELFSLADYFPYANVTNSSSRIRYNFVNKSYFETQYSYFNKFDENGDRRPSTLTHNLGVSLGIDTKYLEVRGTSDYSKITHDFNGWEYLLVIKPPGDCWSIKFGQKLTAGSEDETNVSFNFQFGGV